MAERADPGSAAAALSEEEQGRANCYGLISRLFYAAPDGELLRVLSVAPDVVPAEGVLQLVPEPPSPGSFPAALETLRAASREADPDRVREEYESLFVGAGKALVTPYTSGYADPNAPDRHLVALRQQLVDWGLARRDGVFEVEDHVSAVCDVMRWLIEHDRPIAIQRAFFDDFVYSGVGTFCDAIDASPGGSYYPAVGAFARAFLRVERDAFDLHVGE